MYRCLECHSEYIECPEYCDCGNDTFEEFEPEVYEQPVQPQYNRPAPPPKRAISPEEAEELRKEKIEKTKSIILICISLIICLGILLSPPRMANKKKTVTERVAKSQNNKLPDVNTYWDNTLPSAFRPANTVNTPIINRYLSSLSSSMNAYLREIGNDFSAVWMPSMVQGSGECRIIFTVNKDGIIDNKKLYVKSRNTSLDDSVLLVLSKVTSFDVPPADYKGERIILAFNVQDGVSKVYYPTTK